MAPVTMPVPVCGLITCVWLEKLKWFGYGQELPEAIASVLVEYDKEQDAKRDSMVNAVFITQALVGPVLFLPLVFTLLRSGWVIGLMIIVLLNAFKGIVE